MASLYGQALSYVCELSQEVMKATINSFLAGPFLNLMAQNPVSGNRVIQNLITSAKINAPLEAAGLFSILTWAIVAEQFISGYGTNVIVYISPHATNQILIASSQYEMLDSSTCSCLVSLSCKVPAAIYFDAINPVSSIYFMNRNKTMIKGMVTDCFPFNGFLESTLECFYDLSCIELLVTNASFFSPLDSNFPSKFSPNSTIQNIFNELMIEELVIDYPPEIFFEQCGPLECSYSYIHRSTILTVITTVVGFVSGLNTLLRFIIPLVVDAIWKVKARFKKSGTPKPVETASRKCGIFSQ